MDPAQVLEHHAESSGKFSANVFLLTFIVLAIWHPLGWILLSWTGIPFFLIGFFLAPLIIGGLFFLVRLALAKSLQAFPNIHSSSIGTSVILLLGLIIWGAQGLATVFSTALALDFIGELR